MSEIQIKNADIGLQSANMIDTFIDLEIFTSSDLNEHRKEFISLLNEKIAGFNSSDVVFSIKSRMDKVDYDVKRSEGSVAVSREKVYLAYAQFNDLIIDQVMCKSLDKLIGIENPEDILLLKSELTEILQYLNGNQLSLVDIEVKFGVFGEVLFFGRIPLRNENLSIEVYKKISHFMFKITRLYYKEKVSRICTIYLDCILNIHRNKNNKIFLLVPLHSEVIINTSSFNKEKVNRRCLHSFTWSHNIYNNELFNLPDVFLEFSELIKNEVDVSKESIIHSRNTRIFIGWSHSIFLTSDIDDEEKMRFVHFYKIPVEIEWGEWEFLRSLNRKVDIALFESYKKLEEKAFRFKKLSAYKKSVDSFYYFTKRIIKSYDGLSLTVNPTQLELIEVQRMKWKLDSMMEKFDENLASLKDIISYLSERKREANTKVLNGILFIIALLSVIDISNTIYEIIKTGNHDYIYFTLLPATSILVLLLLYMRLTKD